MDEVVMKQVYEKQQSFAKRIFSPVQTDVIQEDILGVYRSKKLEERLISN